MKRIYTLSLISKANLYLKGLFKGWIGGLTIITCLMVLLIILFTFPQSILTKEQMLIKKNSFSNNPQKIHVDRQFNLNGKDREVVEVEVTTSGKIEVKIQWSGTAQTLALILNGPGQVQAYAREDGKSPLSITYEVTQEMLSLGKVWKVSVVNFNSKVMAKGKLRITYPVVQKPIPEWTKDTDNDGLNDKQKVILGTDPENPDTDDDGVNDYVQLIILGDIAAPGNIQFANFQPELFIDPDDPDSDGLTNAEEEEYGTDPNDPDTDNDFLSDAYEALEWNPEYKTSPTDPDFDKDGLVDGREIWWACNPHKGDTDGDGFTDKNEIDLEIGQPVKGDGCPYTDDSIEGKDADRDGIPVGAEKREVGTDPMDLSTDGDRYSDGMEFLGYDFYGEDYLPAYVQADPFAPSTPDIVIEVDPDVKLNLAQKATIGEKEMDMGVHTYTVNKGHEEKATLKAGVEISYEVEAGWPPWKSGGTAKTKSYVNVGFESSASFSQKWEDKEVTSEESYMTKETDLSGSTLQLWIYIANVGNDILKSPLKEIMLNFYMGNDKNPFHSKKLSDVATNIKIGEEIKLTLEVPINFEQFQRFQAGEGVEVRIAHYSFGDDQIYLENAKAKCIQIDIDDGEIVNKNYVFFMQEEIIFLEACKEADITIEFSEDGSYIKSINEKEIQTGTLPYKWWSLYFKIGDREVSESIQNTKLYPGDFVLLKYGIDSDGDLLTDNEERLIGTKEDDKDTDSDGLTDGQSSEELSLHGEREYGTNPLLWDTDGDEWNDRKEIEEGTDPLDSSSHPAGPTGVTLYKDVNFNGTSETFTTGDPNLTDNLIGDNAASSIEVVTGYIVTLFENINWNYGGKLETLIASDSDLRDYNIIGDNHVSSLKVSKLIDSELLINHFTSFGLVFQEDDGLAVGDVNGDGIDEIVHASYKIGQITIYNVNGKPLYGFHPEIKRGDDLSVGDVNKDGIDEIVHAGCRGWVRIYDMRGNIVRNFRLKFDAAESIVGNKRIVVGMGDRLAVGDVNKDGFDEIVHGDMSADCIKIYNMNGKKLGEINSFDGKKVFKFDSGDGLAVGDVNNDGKDEIVHGDKDDWIRIYNDNGDNLGQFGLDFQGWDGLAVGDVNGDGIDEIIHGDRGDYIRIYDMNGEILKEFRFSFAIGDGFAIGDINGDGMDEIIRAERDWISIFGRCAP